jgi:hypothetical protein
MKSGLMVGKDRPVGRVTWSKATLQAISSRKLGVVRYLDKTVPEFEMFNIKTIEIDRSIGQDSATCTITMYNARAATTRPEGVDTNGTAGYLTPGRGTARPAATSVYDTTPDTFGTTQITYPTSWGYAENPYRDVFIPNTVLRTYQGYGSDNFDAFGNPRDLGQEFYVAPQDDTQLYMTGLWLIDKATFNIDGTITIECRDLAKLLIEQYIYPPMIPIDRFPLIYCPAHSATGHKESVGKNVAKFHSSSVDKAYGHNAAIFGHRGSHAFDHHNSTFWLSGGNSSAGNVEWLQAKTHGDINEIVLHTYGGNYQVYVSVHENGKWQGDFTISGTSEDHANFENLSANEGNGSGGYFYVITKGDTLWDLAGTYYGDNLKWPIIANANNNIIKDPHWIYPGQKIKIPYVAGTKSPPPANTGDETGGTTVDLKCVMMTVVPKSGKVTISLPRTYKADYVRVVFTALDSIHGAYRAGVREMTVRNHIPNTYIASTLGKSGFIQDWTEPIKEMCAWAGLTWPDATPNPADAVLGYTTNNNAEIQNVQQTIGNLQKMLKTKGITTAEKAQIQNQINVMQEKLAELKAAPHSANGVPLRVWGDFEILGAGPVVCTPGDYFLSKSFMDGIRQIVDFIGGIFFIDESGGAQFRLPNIWSGGNFVDDTSAFSTLGARFSEHPIEFHEEANLTSYQMTISDESLRSEVLVIGGYPDLHAAGPVAGGYVLGTNGANGTPSAIDFTNVLAGQYRLMILPGDSTKLFYTEAECQRMAELTALFILFTYRQGTLKAPAHPGLQVDDQVRIFERITSESYIHYVSSLNTHMDLETGEYSMDVTTHWLGSDPDTEWFINKQNLTPAVLSLPAILARIGKQAGGDVFEQPPYGVT